MNDNFVALALWTLIKFENSGIQVSWLPSWLVAPSQPADVEGAIRQLIALGVTPFDAEPKRKLVLQYSACARRIAKIAMVLIPIAAKLGSLRHQQLRQVLAEMHEAKFMRPQEKTFEIRP